MKKSLWLLLFVLGPVYAAAPPVTVHAVVPRAVSYRPAIRVFARVHGPDHVLVRAPYDAVMGPLPVAPGTRVAAGTVVARLLPTSLAATIRALQAQAAAAKTAYEQARVLARQGLVTPARAHSLRAQWQAHRAAWFAASVRLARGVVRAPFAGNVRYRAAPGAWLARGAPAVQVAGAGGLYETCAVTVHAAALLYAGARARLAPGTGQADATGRVYALGTRLDRLSLVRVYVRGLATDLRPGQVVWLTLFGHRRPAFAVPRAALLMHHGQPEIYVVHAGYAQAVPVTVGHIGVHDAYLTGHWAPGARVIVSHVARIRSHTRVQVAP